MRPYHVATEEVIGRIRCKPEVARRILRLNGPEVHEGAMLRGYLRKAPAASFMHNDMSVQRFLRTFGRAAYRSLPRSAFRWQGKRRAVLSGAVRDLHNRQVEEAA